MSETLHTMIAWNHLPTIYTYQEVIKGLCWKEKHRQAFCATHLHHDDPRASSLTV
ncbi:unnamed protein product [Brassica oleracea]